MVLENLGENLEGKIFSVWGLAFKAGTDDMRESSAITIINKLTELVNKYTGNNKQDMTITNFGKLVVGKERNIIENEEIKNWAKEIYRKESIAEVLFNKLEKKLNENESFFFSTNNNLLPPDILLTDSRYCNSSSTHLG